MRRAARTDANHSRIVAAFRKMGCSVLDLSRVGQGCPDILVGCYGVNILCEIKDGAKSPSQRKLTPDEVDFHKQWKGSAHIVEKVEDCATVLNLYFCKNPIYEPDLK